MTLRTAVQDYNGRGYKERFAQNQWRHEIILYTSTSRGQGDAGQVARIQKCASRLRKGYARQDESITLSKSTSLPKSVVVHQRVAEGWGLNPIGRHGER